VRPRRGRGGNYALTDVEGVLLHRLVHGGGGGAAMGVLVRRGGDRKTGDV
jgi:hypothetical protein